MNYDDTLAAHIDACIKEGGDGKFSLAFDPKAKAKWAAASGETKAAGDTATAAAAALLTMLRDVR